MLPPHLELASRLNAPSSRSACLSQFISRMSDDSTDLLVDVLCPVLPYLTLETLLSIRLLGQAGGQGGENLAPLATDIEDKLYDLIDLQRDWVVSSECPVELRDFYLVRVFGEEKGKEAFSGVKQGMAEVAERMTAEVGKGMVLKAEKESVEQGKICESLGEFEKGLKELSGGLLEKLDWSNVILGGGSVLSLLTGKAKEKCYANSDFDLFLYGLKPEELIPKVSSIIDQIKAALPPPKSTKTHQGHKDGEYKSREIEVDDEDEDLRMDTYFEWDSHHMGELMILKGFNAISLVPRSFKAARRIIQIVLVSNDTIFDALAPFDLDACCVGWTGKEVVALPRAVRALSLGEWRGGVNLLDTKVARKLDPTSANGSSRALKYLARGFSLALPQAALKILKTEGVSLEDMIAHATKKASSEDERKKAKVEDLAGLEGLMRRKWNKEHAAGQKEALGADYGPTTMGYMKPIRSSHLKWENGALEHETWEFQIKLAGAVHDLIAADEADMLRGKAAIACNIATYVVPYVPGFDKEHLLELKPAEEATESYAWSHVTKLQYAVKLPRNLLPLAEKADSKMKNIIAAASADQACAAPLKKAKEDKDGRIPASLSQKEVACVKKALEIVRSVVVPGDEANKRNEDIYPSSSASLKPLIPDCFSGPYKGERRLLYGLDRIFMTTEGLTEADRRKEEETKAAKKTKGASSAEGSFLAPLVGYDGKEVAVTKKAAKAVWKVATLAGLWQFKGLDEEIDRVRDAVWQAHVLTARTAVSLPSGIPLWLLGTPGNEYPDSDDDIDIVSVLRTAKGHKKNALERYLAQPTRGEVLKRMKSELAKLEKLVEVGGKGGGAMEKLGEWDEERKRFLLEWVQGKEMI
ncbi:hypothetical protein JCM11251_003213 [Rhodosporidiobolus azoricus]